MTFSIPTLMPEDIECRVQQVKETQSGVGAAVLLYKNARVDMRILDDVFGPMNWQREHARDNANCIISVWDSEKNQWIRKEDTGTESNTEAEKGLASDSFNRAGFNWGIGRELYTAPFIWIILHSDEFYKDKNGKVKATLKAKFRVSDVQYNERREMTQLVIVDGNGEERFSMKKKQVYNKSADRLAVVRTWLEKVGYKDVHGLGIIKAKTGEHLTRLEDATDEQLSIVVTYCINLDTKRKKGESQ